MTVTVINPSTGTANAGHFDRDIVAIITSSASDPNGQWDTVIATIPLGSDISFTLPQAAKALGHKYTVSVSVNLGVNSLVITPFAGDTVGGQSTYPVAQALETVILLSVGGTNWVVVSDSGVLPIPSTSVRGGVYLLADGDVQSHQYSAPGLSNSMIGPSAVPPADVTNRGGVVLVGTPSDPLEPAVPVIETVVFDGTLTTASLSGKTVTIVNGLIVSIA